MSTTSPTSLIQSKVSKSSSPPMMMMHDPPIHRGVITPTKQLHEEAPHAQQQHGGGVIEYGLPPQPSHVVHHTYSSTSSLEKYPSATATTTNNNAPFEIQSSLESTNGHHYGNSPLSTTNAIRSSSSNNHQENESIHHSHFSTTKTANTNHSSHQAFQHQHYMMVNGNNSHGYGATNGYDHNNNMVGAGHLGRSIPTQSTSSPSTGHASSSTTTMSMHDKTMLPSLHILMDSPPSTSPSNQIPHSNSTRIYAPPPPSSSTQSTSTGSNHNMRQSSSTNNLQQQQPNYNNHHMNHHHHQQPITPIPYSSHHQQHGTTNNNEYATHHHAPPYKASHHMDMYPNSHGATGNNMKPSTSSNSGMDATNNMYAPRPIRSRSNTSGSGAVGGNGASFNSPSHHHQQQHSSHHVALTANGGMNGVDPTTVYSFSEQQSAKKKKKLVNNEDSNNENDKKNWKKKRLFSIDEVTDLVAFVKQRSDNQELTRDVNYAIFKEYEKLQDERRRASVYRKKYVQLFERHLIAKDGTIDPSLFQEYDQRASSKPSTKVHSDDHLHDKRKYSEDIEEDSSSEGSNLMEDLEKKPLLKKLKVMREYSDEEEEEVENGLVGAVSYSHSPISSNKSMNICVSYKGRYYLHSIEKSILQNSDSIHHYFSNLSVTALCGGSGSSGASGSVVAANNNGSGSGSELVGNNESSTSTTTTTTTTTTMNNNNNIEYFDYTFNEFIQINSFSIARVLKNGPVKLRIN